ncbi:MAG: crossover junction endodeoxyribonuclease RuvC [Candidatus Ryanbacteria bacterium]|nr:crossover junction endodeoxyribonuclease RuvC [Candidatus Ryanbacteria bacterium]
MRVLGVDPGIERVGWGIVDTIGAVSTYYDCGRITTPRTLSHQGRLEMIAQELGTIIKTAKPECAVVERLFFAKNKKTALAVAEARGVIMLTLSAASLPTQEFTPMEVKMAVTGNGRAEKKQVAWMVHNILKVPSEVTSDDALDALALCLMIAK